MMLSLGLDILYLKLRMLPFDQQGSIHVCSSHGSVSCNAIGSGKLLMQLLRLDSALLAGPVANQHDTSNLLTIEVLGVLGQLEALVRFQ